MNLARQPFLLALLTLLALVTACMCCRPEASLPAGAAGSSPTFAARWLLDLHAAWPRVSWTLCGLLAVLSALMLGRLGVRYKLYSGGSLLAIPFYAVIACGVCLPADAPVGFSASFLLVLALRRYCASCRNGYAFDALFRGSICLGAIPLLYAPALPVAILLPAGLLLFKRTVRELLVALSGFLLPLFAFSYLHWAFGGSFGDVAMQLSAACGAAAAWNAADSVVALLLLAVLACIVLGGLFYQLDSRYTLSTKARAILSVDFWLLAACCAIPFLAGPSALLLPLVAVPASVLIPFLFVRLNIVVSNLLYLFVLALVVLHLFF